MIYTITLNPSIDYIVRLDELKLGITNRTTSEEYYYQLVSIISAATSLNRKNSTL